MRFGRRARGDNPGDPAAFWSWWEAEGREQATAAFEPDAPAASFDALTAAVRAVHPELAWEIGPGEVSAYELVVTAAGDPRVRAAARRWLMVAPPADVVWSFTDLRAPTHDPEDGSLSLEHGPELDLARVRVTARAAGSRFDVVVHHPAFTDLDETDRAQLAFLALDQTLGERDVALWLGGVETSRVGLIDGFGLDALRAVVADSASRHLDADGEPTWVLLSGTGPDGPVAALTQVPLHPLTAPTLERHAVVLLPYAERTDAGLPATPSLDALRAFEERLSADLGPAGRVVAHESSAGARTLHLYLDDTTDALSVVRRHAARWAEGRARVESTVDPAWDGVRHLRT